MQQTQTQQQQAAQQQLQESSSSGNNRSRLKHVATVLSFKQLEEDSSNPDPCVSACQGAKLPMYIYSDHAPSKAQRGGSWEGVLEGEGEGGVDTSSPLTCQTDGGCSRCVCLCVSGCMYACVCLNECTLTHSFTYVCAWLPHRCLCVCWSFWLRCVCNAAVVFVSVWQVKGAVKCSSIGMAVQVNVLVLFRAVCSLGLPFPCGLLVLCHSWVLGCACSM